MIMMQHQRGQPRPRIRRDFFTGLDLLVEQVLFAFEASAESLITYSEAQAKNDLAGCIAAARIAARETQTAHSLLATIERTLAARCNRNPKVMP